MSGFQASDTMPKLGHVTDLREQWLLRSDGALAHHLQDREISSHLVENRHRNQQIREDFPVALSEQRGIEHEVYIREAARRRQAEIDAEIAREMAEINLRRQRRHQTTAAANQASSSRAAAPEQSSGVDIDPNELGLSATELEEMRRRLQQEERDARLARELSHATHGHDTLLDDMRVAVEVQDGELARLLQEREYKKLQKAKEKAKQKALLKKQQRLAAQQSIQQMELPPPPQTTLCDAYSNPRDLIQDSRLRLCKSVDSDLNYVEPFEKEHIQSKASALQAKEISKQYYPPNEAGTSSNSNIAHSHSHSRSFEADKQINSGHNFISKQHRQPPPPPSTGKKPRFPDPVSIRPASHYPADHDIATSELSQNAVNIPHSYSDNNNLYSTAFPLDQDISPPQRSLNDRNDPSKRLSVISDITAEGLAKKKTKQAELQKKRKGCKIQ